MDEGIIEVNSVSGKEIGFTSDKFQNMSFLWKSGDYIYVNIIVSTEMRKGYFTELLNNIWSKNLGVKVTTPFGLMEHILIKKGFTKTEEYSEDFDDYVEVWVKEGE